jgi:hypothetical protein
MKEGVYELKMDKQFVLHVSKKVEVLKEVAEEVSTSAE